MKHSLKATSIIEALVVLLVVVSGIVGVFGLLNASQGLADSTSSRIEAIQIARDGLEAMTNIRDTNSQLFAADLKNCWNVLNYNNACIGDDTWSYDIIHTGNQWLTLSKNANNQFIISVENNSWWYNDTNYRNNFRVNQDTKGFYTQNWGAEFFPVFTREIQVNYLNADNSVWDSNSPKMQVTVLVQWNDIVANNLRKLEMSTVLTNWRSER